MNTMRYIIWDWNGTLLDDVAVCIDVMNGMLRRRGLCELTPESYREIFTFPVENYYRAAGLDLEREPFTRLAAEYIGEFNRRAMECGLRHGAKETLEALSQKGYVQIIVSASERRALAGQVEHYGIGGYFQAVLGIGDILAVTKEGVARRYMEENRIPAGGTTFIGDTGHDWQVARGIGCRCLLMEGGHESRERLEGTGAAVVKDMAGVLEKLAESPQDR